jgi:hypothetical protein
MTLRTVVPADGSAQLTVNYDHGGMTVQAGQVIDVPVGSALESAIGTTNLVALTGTALTADQQGLDPSATGN